MLFREVKPMEFQVYVPSARTFMLQYRYSEGIWKAIPHWEKFQKEVQVIVEPLVRERWALYKAALSVRLQHMDSVNDPLERLMYMPVSPSMYYDISEKLARQVQQPKGAK